MMIMAGCFLIEFFRKRANSSLRSLDDPNFSMACKRQYIEHDLLLLENQLPWFILQTLFNLTMPNDQRYLSLIELVLKFFCTYFSMTTSYKTRPRVDIENLHMIDLIRNVLVSSYSDVDQTSTTNTDNEKKKGVKDKPELIPCVTRLLGRESYSGKVHQIAWWT